MSISELRDEFQESLAGFLWDEWAQMGVSASTSRHDTWATDPEALLLLTFEVGRGEPRLFEEVLDWMLVNERLLSVQRLRNLVADDEDRRLIEAVLGWLGQNRRRARLGARSGSPKTEGQPQPFFRGSLLQVPDPDPAFLAQGFLKPRTESSGKSRAPDVRLPINFAFRLRLLLGVGVRAEVARALLTTDAPWMNVQALAESTAYAKRNVQEAVSSLAAAGFVDSRMVGNENRYEASARWAEFLEVDRPPGSEDWPQLFRAYRLVLRWLVDRTTQGLSDYLLLSSARTLIEEVERDLLFAGVPVSAGESTRDLASLERFVRGLLRSRLSVDR
jgi:DNA-binding transcriptional ArsR family regulator